MKKRHRSLSSSSSKLPVTKHDNPLARARQQPHLQSGSKVESLWHKKSGAGYSLFVSYYANQPEGVVVTSTSTTTAAADAKDDGTKSSSCLERQELQVPIQRTGLSRASKRRKKQQGKNKPQHLDDDVTDSSSPLKQTHPSAELSPKPCTSSSSSSLSHLEKNSVASRLWQAWLLEQSRRQEESKQETSSWTVSKLDLGPLLEHLTQPLPLSFRIRQHCQPNLLEPDFDQNFNQLLQSSSRGFVVEPAAWNASIFQAKPNDSPMILSKSNLSQVAPDWKEFLMHYSSKGCLARQEVGSMLPVLALWAALDRSVSKKRSKSCFRVLDLCAAPGSKTLQMLEQMLRRATSDFANTAKLELVANDINANRLEALQQAMARSAVAIPINTSTNAPLVSMQYTQHNASQYPIPVSNKKKYHMILVDVPCSGDGTIRKDTHVLPAWTPNTANALHSLQVAILIRALQCVREDHGMVCYSTCSLNPVENEAVVAAALEHVNRRLAVGQSGDHDTHCDDCFQVQPWPLSGSKLIHRPGVKEWRVADYVGLLNGGDAKDAERNDQDEEDEHPRLRWHASYDQAVLSGMANAVPTMWPSPASGIGLENCFRLLPQDHDTGGFFVALIGKKRKVQSNMA